MTHEFGIVNSLVSEVLKNLKQWHIAHVAEIRLRRGSAFSEDSLRQAYDSLIQGTPLQDAKLVIETINLNHECPCGHKQVINSDDLVGHMFICPVCGTMREIEEAHDLELIKVIPAPQAHVHITA